MIRVHRIPFSTNVERVALAAGIKGVEVDWVDHEPGDRGAVVEASGQPLVPVAELGVEVVRGSMRIVERIDREFPEPPLYPRHQVARSRSQIFIEWFDRVWKGPSNALDGPTPPDADALRRRIRTWSGWLEDLLAEDPFLAGRAPGAADICAFPFLKYATRSPEPDDDERFHAVLHSALAPCEGPRLAEWIDRVDSLPRS